VFSHNSPAFDDHAAIDGRTSLAQPYVGEIRLFAGNFAPAGWAFCDGTPLAISENETLFQLLGTTYGGDGESTFNLPDMRGRVPLHQGNTFILAETGGVEEVTLTTNQIPSHTHPLLASPDPAAARSITGAVFGRALSDSYASEYLGQALAPQSVAAVGGSQPHTNFQPYLCVNYIISLFGIFPSAT
jgi:microcystin-dependent protein